MKSLVGFFAIIAVAGLAVPTVAWGVPGVVWSGNGHSYQVVATGQQTSWAEADAAAIAAGGYLATITSQAENDFVYSLLTDPQDWFTETTAPYRVYGPWLGAVKLPGSSDPSANWTWVTGEPWVYTNWSVATGEPNNYEGIGEDRACFWYMGDTYNTAPVWDDASGSNSICGWPQSYVIEYAPVPEPATLALLPLALGAAAFYRKPRKVSATLR